MYGNRKRRDGKSGGSDPAGSGSGCLCDRAPVVRSGVVEIPLGCSRINYGERMEYLPQCDLVVSATASPNFTLRLDQFEGLDLQGERILIDLAGAKRH